MGLIWDFPLKNEPWTPQHEVRDAERRRKLGTLRAGRHVEPTELSAWADELQED